MNQKKPGQSTLVTVHGYAGDRRQIEDLMPVYEHHQCPIVVMSPEDSPVLGLGPHICRTGGKRAYTGQLSLDRQYEHFRIMLEYKADFYLANDSDSFCLNPNLPQEIYDGAATGIIYSNQVDDFRKPGQTYTDANGSVTWPLDYHAGYDLIAMQPPYFFSRASLEKIVATCKDIKACPTTPFIDWYFVQVAKAAGLKHAPYPNGWGASCETVTPLGVAVMSQQVSENNATFVHAIKNASVRDLLVQLYNRKHNINWKPKNHY